MGRTKGAKNKKYNSIDVLGIITKNFQSLGITSADLSKKFKKGSTFTQTDLIELFAKHKPELEKMQVRIPRGRSAGTMRALKQEEILQKFAEKIAIELEKVSEASSLMQRLTEQAKDKPLDL